MQALPRPIRSPSPLLGIAQGAHITPWGGNPMRRLRAIRRGVSILLFTAVSVVIQSVFLLLPGRPKVWFARVYWYALCRMMGMRVRLVGQAASGTGRPVVYASNHSSWLDILSLGGSIEACFIAKEEVGRWPVIRTVARLGRTVFVSRRARDTGRERDDMRARLAAGDNLLLFPEGTSNDGSRVLPFRSAFFSICEGPNPPLIQPVSVVYDQLGGLPTGKATRALFSWYGDMDLASHFWRLAQQSGLRATVLLHAPIDPVRYASRKELSAAVCRPSPRAPPRCARIVPPSPPRPQQTLDNTAPRPGL